MTKANLVKLATAFNKIIGTHSPDQDFETLTVSELTEALNDMAEWAGPVATEIDLNDGRIALLENQVSELREELAMHQQEEKVTNDTTDENGMPMSEVVITENIEALMDALKLESITNMLWNHLHIIRNGKRFSISFPIEFYKMNRIACVAFLKKLDHRAYNCGLRVIFDKKGCLIIIAR